MKGVLFRRKRTNIGKKGIDEMNKTSKKILGIAVVTLLIAVALVGGVSAVTISYDGNGVTENVPDSQSVSEDKFTVASQGAMVKTDYVFGGWNTNIDASGVHYEAGRSIKTPETDVTLYAQWYPVNTYTWTVSTSGGLHSAVDAWNNLESGNYVIELKNGTYQESGMCVDQKKGKTLEIRAENIPGEMDKARNVTIMPDYNKTYNETNRNRYVFLISGGSKYEGGAITFSGINFDLSNNNGETTALQSSVVYLSSGGSGTEDALLPPDLRSTGRYAHDITISYSTVKGDGKSNDGEKNQYTKIITSPSNSSPAGITLNYVYAENVSYFAEGYFADYGDRKGLTITNCKSTGYSKAFVNNQASTSTTIIKNCTVESFHDYSVRTNCLVDISDTKFTITKDGSYGSGTGVITLRGANKTSVISNCTIDKGGNAATGMWDIYSMKDNVTINDGNGVKITTLYATEGCNLTPVAEIKETGTKYYSLKDAVTAVESNQTINILVDEIDLTPVEGCNKAITVEGLPNAGTEVSTTLGNSHKLNDLTLKNFKFTGSNCIRWAYLDAGKTFTIDSCEFDPTGNYAIHFDGNSGDNIYIKNSTIKGIVAIASSIECFTFDNCTFAGNGGGECCNINVYSKAVFNNCDFSNAYFMNEWRGITLLGNGGSGWADGKYAYAYLNNCTVNGSKNNDTLIDIIWEWCEGLLCIDSITDGNGKFTSGIFVGNPSHANLSLALLASKIADGYTARVYNDMENVWEVVSASQTTLIYNANGGTTNIWNDTGAKDRQVTVTSEKPVRTGYTFANWNTESKGSGTPYAAGAQFNLGSDTILYAQWTPNDYTVTFNNNGGSGVMNAQQFTYGTAKNLNENTFTKNGYTFSGWATSASGSVVYADKQSICDVGNVTLYAVWTEKAKTYGVGGTISGASGTVTVELKQGNTVIKTIENATSLYNFTGVSDELYNVVAKDSSSGKVVTIAVLVSGGDVTNANIEFPSESVNSKVVIETANDTPNVIVSNVDQEAIKQKSTGEVVTVTATVAKEVKAEVPVTETEKVMVQDAISKLEEEKGVTESQVYYNLTVKKQVGSEDATNITETKEVLAFSIPCDANMKVNGVIRYHEDSVQNLTEDDSHEDATYQNVGDKVVIYAKCFSVYAITYSNADPSATTVTMNVSEQYSFSIPEAIVLETTVGTASHGEIMLKANPGTSTKVSIKLATQADDTTNHVFNLSSATSNEKAKYSLNVSETDGTTMLKNVLTGSEVPGYAASAYKDANNIVLRLAETGITSGQKYFLNFTTVAVPTTSGTYTGTLTFDLRVES